ncbi:hypothetical protein QFC22_000729 [Naganishia vaughanmartiniae]|uniref:Uncharacterized protein n=1 Tax=Naganishia vaughanmartiniae TaxID=1424756 RepID=A0ACC2XIW9_9TREE|nr:hypothetical protein QFC22_000729 [Naganishia vaughanmartiniae]
MNLQSGLYGYSGDAIHVVDMHTTGEPTRIITHGYPELQGETLLDKRRDAKGRYDHLRRRSGDMYGALLVHETEHVLDGTADIGVLFLHNEGYSTMCGHATIALGRFLVDTYDNDIFPGRAKLPYDADNKTTTLRLHAPCGVVTVSVPTTCRRFQDGTERLMADPERTVAFTSVPCFASLMDYSFPIPRDSRWPQLQASGRESITISVAYGGAFYLLVDAQELGFSEGLRTKGVDLGDYDVVTKTVKALVEADEGFCKRYLRHPEEEDLSFLCKLLFALIRYNVEIMDLNRPLIPGTAQTQ